MNQRRAAMHQASLKLRNALLQRFKSLPSLLCGLFADSQKDFLNRLTSRLAHFGQTFLYGTPSPLWWFIERRLAISFPFCLSTESRT